MKPIQLSEEQKTKLLEMCEALFPEFEIDEDTYFDENGVLSTNIEIGNDRWEEFNIHWFEFCLTHLAKKVIIDNGLDYKEFCGMTWDLHPVEHLYREFKHKM